MNVLLIPASQENMARSLLQPVEVERAARYLDVKEVDELTRSLGGEQTFRFWGTTMRSFFDRVSTGDDVLFAVSGEGKFKLRARVGFKIQEAKLGQELWGATKKRTGLQKRMEGKTYTMIYEIGDLHEISVDKYAVLTKFGYSELMRGQFGKNVDRVIKEFGSLDKMLQSFSTTPPVIRKLSSLLDAQF